MRTPFAITLAITAFLGTLAYFLTPAITTKLEDEADNSLPIVHIPPPEPPVYTRYNDGPPWPPCCSNLPNHGK